MAKTVTKKNVKVLENINGVAKKNRLSVLKTYKIYIGGKFPRPESGRYYELKDSAGCQMNPLAHNIVQIPF